VSVFHDLESIAIEVDVTVKVQLEKRLQGDPVSSVPSRLIRVVLEGQVVFHGTTGQLDLFVEPRADFGQDGPDGNKDWDRGEDAEEEGRLQTATEFPREPCWDPNQRTEEEDIRELLVTGAVGGERSVFDGGELWQQLAFARLP
jgi:hypothetical protein